MGSSQRTQKTVHKNLQVYKEGKKEVSQSSSSSTNKMTTTMVSNTTSSVMPNSPAAGSSSSPKLKVTSYKNKKKRGGSVFGGDTSPLSPNSNSLLGSVNGIGGNRRNNNNNSINAIYSYIRGGSNNGSQIDKRRIANLVDSDHHVRVLSSLEERRKLKAKRSEDILDIGLELSASSVIRKKNLRYGLQGNGTGADGVVGGNFITNLGEYSKRDKDSGGVMLTDRTHYGENTAKLLHVTSRVKDQQQRNINSKHRIPSSLCYLPLMKEPEEMRHLRVNAPDDSSEDRVEENGNRSKNSINTNNKRNKIKTEHRLIVSNSGQRETGCAIVKTQKTEKENFKLLAVDDTKCKRDEEIVTKMMMEMNSKQLQLVKRDFVKNGGELDLHEFVAVMMKYQPVKESYEAEVSTVAKLCELFSQVDINGDGTMEWAEFTGYIVESSQDRDNFRVDNIKTYNPSIIAPTQAETYDTRIDHVFYMEDLDYLVSCDTNRMMNIYDASDLRPIKTVCGHQGVVHSASHVKTSNVDYLVTSANDSTLGFWETTNFKLCQQVPTSDVQMALEWSGKQYNKLFSGGVNGIINTWDVDKLECIGRMSGHKDIVMDLHSIPTMGVVASASLDSEIMFWDMPTQTLRKSLPGHAKGVFSLSYSPEYRFLLSAGFDHDALVWNPYVQNLICPLKGHTSSLVGVKAIPFTPEIITADNEGTFKIWDIRNFSCVQTFSAAAEEHKQDAVLTSSGYGAEIFANPNQRTRKQKPKTNSDIGTLGSGGGRNSSNLLQKNIENRRNLARTLLFSTSKTIDLDTSLSCFAYATKHRRIVAANHELQLFDYDQPADPLITDVHPTIGVLYNERSLTFTTAAGRSVKLWDAESGRLLRIYRDLSDTEITALCFDGRKRKFITGDHAGKVIIYNLANGARMKELSSHDSEIVSLHSLEEEQQIISCSWDGKIIISDESDPEEAIVLFQLNHHKGVQALTNSIAGFSKEQADLERKFKNIKNKQMKGLTNFGNTAIQRDVTAMDFSKENNLIATGAADMTICLFRADSGIPESLCVGHKAEISVLKFISPHPILASADVDGNVLLWRVNVANAKISSFATFYNDQRNRNHFDEKVEEDDDDDSAINEKNEMGKRSVGVLCMQWDAESELLFTGDELGIVRGWSLKNAIESIKTTSGSSSNVVLGEDKKKQESNNNSSFFLTEETNKDFENPKSSNNNNDDNKNYPSNRRRSVRSELEKLKDFEDSYTPKRKRLAELTRYWKSHQAGVRSIILLENPKSIVTTSFDCMVYFWKENGILIGSLYQGSSQDQHVDRHWNFPIDREKERRLAIDQARQVLETLTEETDDDRIPRIGEMGLFSSKSRESIDSDQGFASDQDRLPTQEELIEEKLLSIKNEVQLEGLDERRSTLMIFDPKPPQEKPHKQDDEVNLLVVNNKKRTLVDTRKRPPLDAKLILSENESKIVASFNK